MLVVQTCPLISPEQCSTTTQTWLPFNHGWFMSIPFLDCDVIIICLWNQVYGPKQSPQTNQPPNNQSQTQPKNHCRAPAASPIPKSNHSVLSSMTVKRSQAKISDCQHERSFQSAPLCMQILPVIRVPCCPMVYPSHLQRYGNRKQQRNRMQGISDHQPKLA